MRRILVVGCLLSALLAPARLTSGARAADAHPGKAAHGEGDSSKVFVDKEEFNLDDARDQKRLVEHIRSHEATTVTIEKGHTFAEQVADLGLWTLLVFVVVLAVLWK